MRSPEQCRVPSASHCPHTNPVLVTLGTFSCVAKETDSQKLSPARRKQGLESGSVRAPLPPGSVKRSRDRGRAGRKRLFQVSRLGERVPSLPALHLCRCPGESWLLPRWPETPSSAGPMAGRGQEEVGPGGGHGSRAGRGRGRSPGWGGGGDGTGQTERLGWRGWGSRD